jgi:hypothetical protein
MNAEQFKTFMDAQIKEIEVHKWIESEKAGRDLGNECCFDWIINHSAAFYKYYKEKKL